MLGNFRGIPHHRGTACLDRDRPRLGVFAPVSAGPRGQSGPVPAGADASRARLQETEMLSQDSASQTAQALDLGNIDGALAMGREFRPPGLAVGALGKSGVKQIQWAWTSAMIHG